jgi:hypothetical protein
MGPAYARAHQETIGVDSTRTVMSPMAAKKRVSHLRAIFKVVMRSFPDGLLRG